MQERGESRMGQDRDCRPVDPISLIPGDECVLLCPFLCGVVHYIPRTKPHHAYCHSSSLVCQREVLRHPSSPFSCIEVGTIRTSLPKRLRGAVKNCLHSLSTGFYQDGFFKLISRYDKCINVGAECVKNSQKVVFCYGIVCFRL
ncbi:hypothetical protein AVEN_240967-1 [Araneus ventricosus]|uniref:Uncharacterized protein n=1 Tax=Araneus ventricosus TaxID=182803 RepID=A0A4Y2K542_ARAVE|nr:hypothetical protein AVEN_240967-1 [Araneus ventricosus]